MAGLRCADAQSRPTEFLDFPSLTLEEFQILIPPFEAAFQAHRAAWRFDGTPRTARRFTVDKHLSLSRLNHWPPRGQAHPEVVQGTAEFHHQIADTLLPQAEPVFDNATALHTAVDMLDPQPAIVQGLVG